MPKEAEEQVITISAEAVQAVQDIMNEKKMDNHGLRIYVAGSSCSGVQFGMALDDNIQDTDTTIEADGVKIIVDHQSLDYARGANIEFVNDPQKGTGFIINAPQTHNSCGGGSCGSEANSCGGDSGCSCDH